MNAICQVSASSKNLQRGLNSESDDQEHTLTCRHLHEIIDRRYVLPKLKSRAATTPDDLCLRSRA
jgi:hypothetical protein